MKKFSVLLLLLCACKGNITSNAHTSDPCDQPYPTTYTYTKNGMENTIYNVIDIVIGPETNYFLGSDFISARETTITYLDKSCCCIKYEIITKKVNILTNESIKE